MDSRSASTVIVRGELTEFKNRLSELSGTSEQNYEGAIKHNFLYTGCPKKNGVLISKQILLQ